MKSVVVNQGTPPIVDEVVAQITGVGLMDVTDSPTSVITQKHEPKRHRILLVDPRKVEFTKLKKSLEKEPDHEIQHCLDSNKAVEMAIEFKPTVILMGLRQKRVNGFELIPMFKAHDETKGIPLVVYTSVNEQRSKTNAFSVGADDYIVKGAGLNELRVRVLTHSERKILGEELISANAALRESEVNLRRELDSATEYVRSILPLKLKNPFRTDWRYMPSSAVGGDAFDVQQLDKDHMSMWLLDVSGHGIGSALMSISAFHTVHNRTLENTDFKKPSEVLTSLNRAFQMEENDGHFFTMWYGVLDRRTNILTYSGAGHHPALLVPKKCHDIDKIKLLHTPGMGIGMDENSQFEIESTKVEKGDTLYLFSDGVFEVEGLDGKDWNRNDFTRIVAGRPDNKSTLDYVIDTTRKYQGKENFPDDYSIVEVEFTEDPTGKNRMTFKELRRSLVVDPLIRLLNRIK